MATKTQLKKAPRRARPPLMSLQEPGRLRIANLMYLFQCSHQTVYVKVQSGQFPPPDGQDPRPYWSTETILPLLTKTDGAAGHGGAHGQ